MLDYRKLADEKHGFLTKPLRWSWGRLGGHLGPSWGPLGAVLGCLGHFGGRPGAVFGRLGAVLEPFWAILGRLGAVLGSSLSRQRLIKGMLSDGGAAEQLWSNYSGRCCSLPYFFT
jgi:hypothetical protein